MKRVVFLGSKPIGMHCLQQLCEHAADYDIEVVAVFTNDNNTLGAADLSGYAAKRDIPVYNSLEGLEEVAEVDYLISVQYHEILKAHHIERARELAINLHMAPLPEYRGCNQFSFAIIDGKKEFGTTIHKMETGIDNGAIIAEKRFLMPEGLRVNQLYDLTVEASKELFEEAIGMIFEGDFELVPQEELEAERGCSLHYRKEMAEIKKIDLNWPEEKIWRYVRATNMPGFPPPYAEVNGQRIYLSLDQK